jgi:hypothetical protein
VPYTAAVPPSQRRYAIVCCAIVGWCLAYALASWSRWTRLMYDPLAREWSFSTRTSGPVPIDYWGLVAWGIGGAVVGVALALIGSALWRRPLPRLVQGLLGAWAFMWTLWPF